MPSALDAWTGSTGPLSFQHAQERTANAAPTTSRPWSPLHELTVSLECATHKQGLKVLLLQPLLPSRRPLSRVIATGTTNRANTLTSLLLQKATYLLLSQKLQMCSYYGAGLAHPCHNSRLMYSSTERFVALPYRQPQSKEMRSLSVQHASPTSEDNQQRSVPAGIKEVPMRVSPTCAVAHNKRYTMGQGLEACTVNGLESHAEGSLLVTQVGDPATSPKRTRCRYGAATG